MAATVPNQKVVHVNRDMPDKNEGNFLLIKKANDDLFETVFERYFY